MKKIVTTIAALAMAVSMFAADVSAKVQLEGSLFTTTDGNISALDIDKPSAQHWNPIMNFAFNGDKAGAEFAVFTGDMETKIAYWNKGYAVHANRFKLWMSPTDGLKFIFGLNGFNLNQETILWSKTDSGCEDYGYGINYANNGFALDVAFLSKWKKDKDDEGNTDFAWLTKAKGGKAAIAPTALKAEYAADFGKINGILVASDTFKDLKFGAGYSNTFGGVNMFANVLGYYKDSFNKVRVELFAKGNIDGFGWSTFIAPNINLGDKTSVDLQFIARGDYAFGSVNAYLLVGGDGKDGRQGCKFGLVEDKSLDFTIQPGVSGNVGGASWDVGLKFDYQKDKPMLISVPLVLSMGF